MTGITYSILQHTGCIYSDVSNFGLLDSNGGVCVYYLSDGSLYGGV